MPSSVGRLLDVQQLYAFVPTYPNDEATNEVKRSYDEVMRVREEGAGNYSWVRAQMTEENRGNLQDIRCSVRDCDPYLRNRSQKRSRHLSPHFYVVSREPSQVRQRNGRL